MRPRLQRRAVDGHPLPVVGGIGDADAGQVRPPHRSCLHRLVAELGEGKRDLQGPVVCVDGVFELGVPAYVA